MTQYLISKFEEDVRKRSNVNVPTFGNREFVLAGTVNSSGHTTLSANGTASAEI